MLLTNSSSLAQFGASAAVLLSLCSLAGTAALAAEPQQEFYELRIYQIASGEKQKLVSDHLEGALLPALGRLGIDRVGVFTNLEDKSDFSITMLIPFKTLEAFTTLRSKLAADEAYQQASAEYFNQPLKDPAFTRIESRFLKAFAGMPVIEMPAYSKERKPRIFELRLYESHTEEAAVRKVAMFNDGEIDIMRDVKMAPVFYGETLIGPTVPNLIYMLSAESKEAHQEHWQGFRTHPEWDRMKVMEKYKGTVSKIRNWFLKPTAYSQI